MNGFGMRRRLVAEGLGTALLLATVVGSGIMGERLADGNVALALLCNGIATGAILMVLILIFGPISGGHFNPAVTLAFTVRRELSAGDAVAYVLAQIAGGIVGVVVAHVMFEAPVLAASLNVRTGPAQWASEFGHLREFSAACAGRGALCVGLFITAGYWFLRARPNRRRNRRRRRRPCDVRGPCPRRVPQRADGTGAMGE